jgi:RES domain-containing protein
LPDLWRISKYINLSGEGGKRAANRWNKRGRPIVYLSETASGVLLERMVHLWDDEGFRDLLDLIHIDYPSNAEYEEVDEGQLPVNWSEDWSVTQNVGDSWLERCKTALLVVPSAIMPYTRNFLLNP